MNYLVGLPNFFMYYGSAIVAFLLFIMIYIAITPYDEWNEIKDNYNSAAAIALSGSMIGFALPIASLTSHSVNLVDFAVWSVVAIVVQILTFFLVSMIFKGIQERIKNKDISASIVLASLSVVAGIFNAVCMSY